MELKDKQNRTDLRIVFIKQKIFLLFFVLISMHILQGCYSFTGASISPSVKTISVSYLPNQSQLVQPTLSRKLTETIRDKFTSQAGLSLVSSNGDLNISGEITDYSTEPMAITGDQKSALQRLKITVNIRFTNRQDPTKDFESSFSRFQDYDSKRRLSEVEESLIDLMNADLAQDIFNRAVVNW